MKRTFYQLILKRTSTFCLAIVCSAMFFERAYDHAWEYIFEKCNEGRLWIHVKDKYESSPDQVVNVTSSVKKTRKTLSDGRSEVAKTLKNRPTTSGNNNNSEESK